MKNDLVREMNGEPEVSELERKLESTELDSRSFLQKALGLYFDPKGFERWKNGRIYELLGVKKFKDFLMRHKLKRDPERTQTNYFLQSYSVEGLRDFAEKTKSNEIAHLIPTAGFAIVSICSCIGGHNYTGAVEALLAALNAYPVMLQRYNRSRIDNTLERMEQREKPSIL